MDPKTMRDKFLGSIIGAAIGDAIGAPFEFWDQERLKQHPHGTEWIEDMLPFVGRKKGPRGVWRDDPPVGTGTDDTRLNMVLVEAVIKYGKHLNSRLLAAEFIDRYLNVDRYYPGYHDLATEHFEPDFITACGLLEIECPALPGVPPYALKSGAQLRGGIPSHYGLWALPAAGLLHPGNPEEAYRHTFELAYMTIGYATDATALLAAMIAAGFDESLSPREAIQKGLEVDPFQLGHWQGRGMRLWHRTTVECLNRYCDLAEQAKSDRELVLMISKEMQHVSPLDAIDVLGIAVAACYRSNGDPRRAVLMAANERDLNDKGEFKRFRDIDCTASACGALAGALAPTGVNGFPANWVSAVIAANCEVYGFDLKANAEHRYEVGTRR